MLKLEVVIASTRPGRAGAAVGEWFTQVAGQHGGFEVAVADLAEIDLPFMDEPYHPRMKKYQHQHTLDWSERVAAADAFVFVTPEYNYAMPPTLLNALDYLSLEWNYKPVGFVSYGGISAGTRSVQMAKQVVTTLKMMPVPEAVSVPFFNQFMKDGKFVPNEELEKGANLMLDELVKWGTSLKTIREPQVEIAA